MLSFLMLSPFQRLSVVRPIALLSLVGLAAAYGEPPNTQEAPWPTRGWPTSSPAAQRLHEDSFAELDADIRRGQYGYINRLLVVRNGHVVVNERYDHDYREISRGHSGFLGCGEDACTDGRWLHEYNYYHHDWHPYYQGREVHSLQSVTKSVASTLIGVAIQRGEIESINVPILEFLHDYDLSGVDRRLYQVSLDDLLTMRSGIEWHETDRPIDETNTTLQLERSADWVQFTLDQPIDMVPGEKWVYNSGGSQLLSAIVRQATGAYVDAYAEEHLFRPLGVRDHHWKKTPTGLPDTQGGLYLEAEDLAKIGYLYLHHGVWEGRRILPEGWVEASTSRRADDVNELGWGYGYQWWRPDQDGVEVWAAFGFGGQALLIMPEYNLIGVINGWNLFGGQYPSVVRAMLETMLESVVR